MALVSYDYSSGSDGNITDEEEDSAKSRAVVKTQNVLQADETTKSDNSSLSSGSGLFSHLPQVKSNLPQISEESDQLEDFIPTVKNLKEKKKVQIIVPSLSEFEEPNNEEPVQKRLKPSQIGSGLLGILPPVQSAPKSNTMFVPNTLKKKNIPSKRDTELKAKAVIPQSVKKAMANKKKLTAVKNKTESDSDTDNEDMVLPDSFDDQMWEKVCGRSKPPPDKIEIDMTAKQDPEELTSAPEPKKPYDGLDNVAFKELVGKSKRPVGNIKLIDINEEEILPDKDLWMTKSLTDPDLAPRAEPQDTVDPTKKRKHHITYLAQQAKANEQELKSAWAAGRNNRMMSRSKYGF